MAWACPSRWCNNKDSLYLSLRLRLRMVPTGHSTMVQGEEYIQMICPNCNEEIEYVEIPMGGGERTYEDCWVRVTRNEDGTWVFSFDESKYGSYYEQFNMPYHYENIRDHFARGYAEEGHCPECEEEIEISDNGLAKVVWLSIQPQHSGVGLSPDEFINQMKNAPRSTNPTDAIEYLEELIEDLENEQQSETLLRSNVQEHVGSSSCKGTTCSCGGETHRDDCCNKDK